MICDCGHPESEHSDCTRGYGKDEAGKTYCYACCADRDKAQMVSDGRTTLYLTTIQDKAGRNFGWKVTNWPGSLRFSAAVRKGNHNIAGSRYDAWFTDHTGARWHGVQYGEWTQICHCKRMKGKVIP